jgi:sugar-specific transcriptional regulator TrmB
MERLAKSEVIRELEKLHRENIKTMQPEDLTGALKGRQAMLEQVESMLKSAKKSIKVITTDSGFLELMDNHYHLLKKASENGVKIQLAAPVNEKTSEIAKDLGKYAQIRNIEDVEHIEKLVGRLCLVDGSQFILSLTDDEKTHPTQDVALWTQSEHAASNIIGPMFELVWHNSKPLEK